MPEILKKPFTSSLLRVNFISSNLNFYIQTFLNLRLGCLPGMVAQLEERPYDTQYNTIQHNATQHNDIQQSNQLNTTLSVIHSE
jgi:hypothetical protein